MPAGECGCVCVCVLRPHLPKPYGLHVCVCGWMGVCVCLQIKDVCFVLMRLNHIVPVIDRAMTGSATLQKRQVRYTHTQTHAKAQCMHGS